MASAPRVPFSVSFAACLASLLSFGASADVPDPPPAVDRRAGTWGGGGEQRRAVAVVPGTRRALLADPARAFARALPEARPHRRGRSACSARGESVALDRVLLAEQQARIGSLRRCWTLRGRGWHECELICALPTGAEGRGDPERYRAREQKRRCHDEWTLRLHEASIPESASTWRLWPFQWPRCDAAGAPVSAGSMVSFLEEEDRYAGW